MTTFIIPIGTKIYLTREPPYELFIRPDTSLINDTLYVAYDVRLNGVTIIPRGTRVLGDWITETNPSIIAQLQLTRICMNGTSYFISADSPVFDALSQYNATEVNNTNYLTQIMSYNSVANIQRRIVKFPCQVKVLLDENLNTQYIEIYAKEIEVNITKDLIMTF